MFSLTTTTRRTAAGLAAISGAAAIAVGAMPGSAAAAPAGGAGPCEREYVLYQQGWSIIGQRITTCGDTVSVTPAGFKMYIPLVDIWVVASHVEGNRAVYRCEYPGPGSYRLQAMPSMQITATCF